MNIIKPWIAAVVLACSAYAVQAHAACGSGLCAVDSDSNAEKTWAGRNATWGSWNNRGDYFANINGRSRYACLYGSTNFTGVTYALPRGGEFLGRRNFGKSNQWYTSASSCY